MASGQMEGQINELAKPKSEIKITEVIPLVNKAIMVKAIPAMADNLSA